MSNKGYLGKNDTYAKGGAVLGRTRDFMKEPDGADQKATGNVIYKNPDGPDQDYAKGKKGKSGGAPKARPDKSLPAVKPRG